MKKDKTIRSLAKKILWAGEITSIIPFEYVDEGKARGESL